MMNDEEDPSAWGSLVPLAPSPFVLVGASSRCSGGDYLLVIPLDFLCIRLEIRNTVCPLWLIEVRCPGEIKRSLTFSVEYEMSGTSCTAMQNFPCKYCIHYLAYILLCLLCWTIVYSLVSQCFPCQQ